MPSSDELPPKGAPSLLLGRLISGLTVIGVAIAAAIASVYAQDKGVGIAAWVAVSVVGASTMIATARSNQVND